MQTLQIDKNKARKLFPTATAEFQEMLIDTFGSEFFNQKITDRVKRFEDACQVLNLDPEDVLSKSDTADEAAYKKLKVIVKALNEGWEPDWNEGDEEKWYPWFYLNQPGFRLNHVAYHYTLSNVGSRLCFKSRELAEYAAKQFQSIYQDFFTL